MIYKQLSKFFACAALVLCAAGVFGAGDTIDTIAGNGAGINYAEGTDAKTYSLIEPFGVAYDTANNMYVVDEEAHRVLKVDATTGLVTIVAGNGVPGFGGDGADAKLASLNQPSAVVVDTGGALYIADSGNHRIRKVAAGIISTIAGDGYTDANGDGRFLDGTMGTSVSLNHPQGLFEKTGTLYIADTGNHVIWGLALGTGVITRTCGQGGVPGNGGDGGPPLSASLASPMGIWVDGGNNVLVCDSGNNRIRKFDASAISHVAGSNLGNSGYFNGMSPIHRFNSPTGIVYLSNTEIYICDQKNDAIRLLDATTGAVSTHVGAPPPGGKGFAGDGLVAGTATRLSNPAAIALRAGTDLAVVDRGNARVRVFPKSLAGNIDTKVGSGTGGFSVGATAKESALRLPEGVCINPLTNEIFIADSDNNVISKVDPVTNVLTIVAGTGVRGFSPNGTLATQAMLNSPAGVFVDGMGNLYISDSGNHCVRCVFKSDGNIVTVAGTAGMSGNTGDGGPAMQALLNEPKGLCGDSMGGLLIADSINHRVRRISQGQINAFAGSGTQGYSGDGGDAKLAALSDPFGVTASMDGNVVIADQGNHTVRFVGKDGIITTLAGTGVRGSSGDGGLANAAKLNRPQGVLYAPSGQVLIADTGNHKIRIVDPKDKTIKTIIGTGVPGFSGDGGPSGAAQLFIPTGLAGGKIGLVIADAGNSRIRRVVQEGLQIPKILVQPPQQFVNRAVTFTATIPVDPNGNTVFLNWDFGDGTVSEGNPVTKTYSTPGVYTVTASVGTGLDQPQPLMLTIRVFGPPSLAMGKKNVGMGKKARNPLNLLGITVTDSDGGIIQLDVAQDSSAGVSKREGETYSTEFEGTATRSSNSGTTVSGTTVVEQFVDAGISVATTTVTDSSGNTATARKTVTVGSEETGTEDAVTEDLTVPTSSALTLKSLRGKFTFSDNGTATAKNDQVSFSGTFKMPAGFILSREHTVDVAIGNVIDTVTVSAKGKATLPGTQERIKKLTIKYPKLAKAADGVTAGDEEAKLDFTFSIADLDVLGFDTEGVSAANDEAATTAQTLSIQVAMVLSGVPYEGTASATYKAKTKKSKSSTGTVTTTIDSGTLTGSTRASN